MPMKILALDKKKTDGSWRKQWGSLCTDITLVECDTTTPINIKNKMAPVDKGVLVLLHKEPCMGLAVSTACVEDFKTRHASGDGLVKFFIMYVAGGIGLSQSSGDYWIHYAKTPVGTGVDLSHLQNKFSALVEDLEQATTSKDVLVAWKEFDKSALAELLELVAPIFLDDSLPVFLAIREHLKKKDASWRKRAVDAANSMKLKDFAICLNSNSAEATIDYMIRNRDIVNSIARRFL